MRIPPRPARWDVPSHGCITFPAYLPLMAGRCSIATRCKWNPLFCGAERLAGRLGTRVINVCEFEREFAQQWRVCPANTLEVVHNGIAEIPLTRLRPIDTQPPLIVMVARFASQKDHATLLQALSGLLRMEWSLLLVGTGELEPQVTAQVAALGLGDRVRILPAETNVSRLLMEAQILRTIDPLRGAPHQHPRGHACRLAGCRYRCGRHL